MNVAEAKAIIAAHTEQYKCLIKEDGSVGSKDKLGQHDIEIVKYDGGGEGEGDTISVVFKLDHDYFSVNGYHDSWNGNSWDDIYDIYQVVPKEKTIIVYELLN